MAAKAQAVKVDPKEMQRTEEMWVWFTDLMKWGVIGTVGVLVLLGVVFIDW